MDSYIKQKLLESAAVCKLTISQHAENLNKAIDLIIKCYKNGGRVIAFGNGASAADAQHIIGEFVSKFYLDRPMLDAFALTVNMSILTSIGNDYGFDRLFSRQIESLARPKDVILALSTSGNSPNVVNAVKQAKEQGIPVIAFTGQSGGEVGKQADILLNVASEDVARIQEAHILMGHLVCEFVESEMFGPNPSPSTILDRIKKRAEESNKIKEAVAEDTVKIERAVHMLLDTYQQRGRLIAFGNGGSAADAQHIAGQLVNKLYRDRPMLDALSLSVNPTIITAISNDSSYDYIFSRQIESLATRSDVLLAISTSGNSPNVLHAAEVGQRRGIPVIGLTGDTGGKLADLSSILINIPSKDVARIQESHTTIGHIICDLVEQKMFGA